MLIAVASYYLAFAVVDGRSEVMLSELAIAAFFIFERSACAALLNK